MRKSVLSEDMWYLLLSSEQYSAQRSIYRLLGKQIDAIVRQKSDISCAQLVLKPLNPFLPLLGEECLSLAHL